MALDEPKDTDEVYEVDGYKYLVNKEFMEKAASIKVDFAMYGFKLDSGMDFSSDCGGCSAEGSGCST